jgi:hypothetical protein
MAILQSSQILRQYDSRSGHNIKTFYDSSSAQIQAMVMVDDEGDLISSQHTIGNGNSLDVNIRSLNGQASDSFGRLRVSELFPLLETTSRYDIDESIWTNSVTGSGTVSHSAPNASVQLSTVDGTDTNAARLVTLKNFRYQPGKSQLIMQTLSLVNPDEPNCQKRWGYFDETNGVFWQVKDGVFGVTVRNNGVDTFVPQTSFNRDKLDGTGDLLLDTDLTKSQIYYISFQFLGVGIVEFGIYCRDGRVIPAHVFQNANTYPYSYMQTAVLPLRYEVENTATAASDCGINVLCATVNSDSGSAPIYTIVNSAASNFVSTGGTNDEIPILSIRAKTAINGVRNTTEVVPLSVTFACETKVAVIRIKENCTLVGDSYVDQGAQSAVEVDTTATGQSGGKVVDTIIINAGESEVINLENIYSANKQSITYNNAGLQEHVTITIQRVGNLDCSVLAALTWAEIR